MLDADLLKVGEHLAKQPKRGRPSQAKLRRSVSSAYYALFHALLLLAANQLVGSSPQKRQTLAWAKIYRSVEHGKARNCCVEVAKGRWPASQDLQRFAAAFTSLQADRFDADYDPRRRFSLPEVQLLLKTAAEAREALTAVSAQEALEFAAFILCGDRKSSR